MLHISGTNSQKTAGLLPLLFISGDKFLFLQIFGVEEKGEGSKKKVVGIASLFYPVLYLGQLIIAW